MLGIVLSGAAIAGFIAAPLYTLIMQKTGTWKTGWLTAGAFCAAALITAFFIKNKPGDIGQFPDGINPEKVSDTAGAVKTKRAKTYRTSEFWVLKEALRKPVLYLLGICMIAQVSALYLLTTHGVLHLTDVGFTRMQAASVIGNLILFSGFARFPIGILGDRVEPRWILTIALAGMGITIIGIWKAPENLALLFAIGSIFGFCFGSTVPMFPTITGNYFGPAAFAPITGFLSPFMIFIAAPVPLVSGIIYDKFHSYDIAFMYVVIIIFVAAVCATVLVPPKKSRPA